LTPRRCSFAAHGWRRGYVPPGNPRACTSRPGRWETIGRGTRLVHVVLEDLASLGGQVVDVESASGHRHPVGFLVLVLPPNDGALGDRGGDEQGLAAAAFEVCHRDGIMEHRPDDEGGFFGGACATLECEFGRCERHAPGAGPARGTLGEQTARERLSGDGSSHAAAPRVVVHRWCSRWCLALTRFVDELTRIFQDSVSDVSISPADQSESPTRGANTRKQNQVARATLSGEQTSLAFT